MWAVGPRAVAELTTVGARVGWVGPWLSWLPGPCCAITTGLLVAGSRCWDNWLWGFLGFVLASWWPGKLQVSPPEWLPAASVSPRRGPVTSYLLGNLSKSSDRV